MAKKKKKQKAPREFTRRQLSRYQQQKRRQRLVLSVGIAIIVVAAVIIGVGWYFSQFQPMHQTAIRVNDTEFDMQYYIDTLKYYGRGESAEFMEYMVDSILNDIEQNELIKQEAGKLGISISDEEIREKLKSADLPNNAAYRDMIGSRLILTKLLDEHFDKQVPMSAEQVHIMAMLLESERQVTDARARLLAGEDFAELAKEFSRDSLTMNNEGDLDWHPESILTEMMGTDVPVKYAFNSAAGVLSEPLYDEEVVKVIGYWLLKVSEWKGDEEAHVHAILLGSEEEAQETRARLEAGEDFAELAKEFSQMEGAEENGGDWGWVREGGVSPILEEYIFDTGVEIEKLSEPIIDDTMYTKGGYWLVKVLEKDADRQLDDYDRDRLKSKALEEWVASLWDNPDNLIDDSFLDSEKKAWAMEKAKKGLE